MACRATWKTEDAPWPHQAAAGAAARRPVGQPHGAECSDPAGVVRRNDGNALRDGGDFVGAVFSIIVAGIFDGLDGRIARLLNSTSSFGAELDSLSDFVSFGVAPAAVLYLWTMSTLNGAGWAVVLFFAVCCALRL